jgi:hypothetical protein
MTIADAAIEPNTAVPANRRGEGDSFHHLSFALIAKK